MKKNPHSKKPLRHLQFIFTLTTPANKYGGEIPRNTEAGRLGYREPLSFPRVSAPRAQPSNHPEKKALCLT